MAVVAESAEREERPSDRLRAALDLFDFCERAFRHRIRRERPGASEADVDAVIREWLSTRPGAEYGDGPGVVSDRWQ